MFSLVFKINPIEKKLKRYITPEAKLNKKELFFDAFYTLNLN